MKALFSYISVISGILMIATILLQQRGSSLGAGFGGGDTALYQTKRGAEKVFYYATIFLAVIFVVAVILSHLSKR